ncbi:group III truncated hemoglobin [Pseudooceanicola sp. CBS1P-1]|uniref:Preprotein translocase subunit TatC n=1 Tax=Pseudooceanicola albus TaxID=2692189 RepID=A0A6L7G3F1_9RHOB|nr:MULTISPECIES: group III truncated hemoglobin [Pseudooceanicola]MBT9385257.1 group III truncated hemoglobin [Pseudooceanicola endophyticus]MXN18884.1 preprotein translocase subunit TatC [Pseudooceanicola albus]
MSRVAPASSEPSLKAAQAAGLDQDMIRRVVHRFYELVRDDPLIGPVFHTRIPEDHWPQHLDKITAFWSSALLGTRSYGGRPMPKHQAIAELEDAHFRRWLALLRHTVTLLCPPPVAAVFIARSERMAEAFRTNLSMHRSAVPTFLRPLEREDYP